MCFLAVVYLLGGSATQGSPFFSVSLLKKKVGVVGFHVVFVSGVRQSCSVTRMYGFFFFLFAIVVSDKMPNIISRAVQWVSVVYFFI